MTLYKWVRDHLTKFTFITRTEFKRATLYIFYNDLDGVEKHKTLPYRANQIQLLNIINKIKKEIKYEKNRIEVNKKVKAALANEDDTAILGLR